MKIIVSLIVVAALALLTVGCETESSEQIYITVAPNHVTLLEGESYEFQAAGWVDYTWELSNPSIGVLSNNKGDRTVYTALKSPVSEDETLTQVLIVSVNMAASGGSSGTNTVPGLNENVSAQALITHAYTP